MPCREREFFIDNLLVRIHFIIVMIRWTGLAPWEFEFKVVQVRQEVALPEETHCPFNHNYSTEM